MMTPVANLPGAVSVTPLVRQLLGSDATGADRDVDAEAAAIWYEARGAHSAALKCLIRLGPSERLATFLARPWPGD